MPLADRFIPSRASLFRQVLLSLLDRGHSRSVEIVVEDTLFRIACGDGAVVDARGLEDEEDTPSGHMCGGQDLVWEEPPFILE